MQASTLKSIIADAAKAPALAGIYIKMVSIAAVRNPDHDPILRITWSMPQHYSEPQKRDDGITSMCISRPSDTTITIPRELASPAEIEDAIMQCAWELGAWDMCRCEHAPLADDADWRETKYGIMSSFGRSPYIIAGQALCVGDQAGESTCKIAAVEGYIHWRFIPLCLSTPIAKQQWGAKDRTLLADLTRDGEAQIGRGQWMHPGTPQTAHEHQYQLGRAPHGNRSKSNNARRANAY